MRSLAMIADQLHMSEDDVRQTLRVHPDMSLHDYLCNQTMEEYFIGELQKHQKTQEAS